MATIKRSKNSSSNDRLYITDDDLGVKGWYVPLEVSGDEHSETQPLDHIKDCEGEHCQWLGLDVPTELGLNQRQSNLLCLSTGIGIGLVLGWVMIILGAIF